MYVCVQVSFTSSTNSKYHQKIMSPAMKSDLHDPIPSLTPRTSPLQGPLGTSVREPLGYTLHSTHNSYNLFSWEKEVYYFNIKCSLLLTANKCWLMLLNKPVKSQLGLQRLPLAFFAFGHHELNIFLLLSSSVMIPYLTTDPETPSQQRTGTMNWNGPFHF